MEMCCNEDEPRLQRAAARCSRRRQACTHIRTHAGCLYEQRSEFRPTSSVYSEKWVPLLFTRAREVSDRGELRGLLASIRPPVGVAVDVRAAARDEHRDVDQQVLL